MPRCVFNAPSGICFAREFEIHHLPDLEAARDQAHQLAKHFRAYLPRNLREATLTVDIFEEAGHEFMIVRWEAPS